MSDEEENVPQKTKISTYFLYFLIVLIIISLIFVPFLSEEKRLKINLLITQNVEKKMECNCKVLFLNENFSEKFSLLKYDSKFIKKEVIVPKDRNFAIFFECSCIGENNITLNEYNQKKRYIFDGSSNEIYGDIEFLSNDTIIDYPFNKFS